jgi:hypothetical protein
MDDLAGDEARRWVTNTEFSLRGARHFVSSTAGPTTIAFRQLARCTTGRRSEIRVDDAE